MPSLAITTDKPSYLPEDVIIATLTVSGAPTTETLTVHGSVTLRLPDGTPATLPASTDVTIGSAFVIDEIAGYDIVQHAPGVFTLTPTG